MFPIIHNFEDVEYAIKDRNEFKIFKNSELSIFGIDYHVNFCDTFPDINTNDEYLNTIYKIRRECRGIKFNKNGEIISRPYHKFFNVGEREETLPYNLSWDDYIIMDKLDGSMIDAIIVNDNLYFCTKAGFTPIAKECQKWVENNNKNIIDFSYQMIKNNITPIFEWCSLMNRVVIEYKEPKLILTGARNLHSGEYIEYYKLKDIADIYNVPIVNVWTEKHDSISSFIDNISKNINEEGYVISWKNGYRVKIKNEWYLQIHKNKENLKFEKDVWRLVLTNKLDDILPFVSEEERNKLIEFSNNLNKKIVYVATKIENEVKSWISLHGENKKEFSINFVNSDHIDVRLKGFYFNMFDSLVKNIEFDIHQSLIEFFVSYTNTLTKLESVRSILDIEWGNIYYNEE